MKPTVSYRTDVLDNASALDHHFFKRFELGKLVMIPGAWREVD